MKHTRGEVLFLWILLSSLILNSCASQSLRPLSPYEDIASPKRSERHHLDSLDLQRREEILNSTHKKNLKWYLQYTLADKQFDLNKSCGWFLSLASEKEFPLHHLAAIKAMDLCATIGQTDLNLVTPETLHPTYRNSFYQMSLRRAKLTANLEDDFVAINGILSTEKDRRNRESLLVESIKIAEALHPEQISNLKQQLYENSPRLNPNPQDTDLINVGKDFRHQRLFKEALRAFSSILNNRKSLPTEKYQAQMEVRQTYKISGPRELYVKATLNLLKLAQSLLQKTPKEPSLVVQLHDAYLLWARTIWTEGKVNEAVLALNEATKALKGRHSLAEITYLRGRIHEEQKEYEEALAQYELSKQERSVQPESIDQRLWSLAWLQYKMKRSSDAALNFQKIILESKSSSERSRAQFWLAQLYGGLGQTQESVALYEDLARHDSLGYYGLLSYRELKKTIPPLSRLQPNDFIPLWSSSVDPRLILEIDWLLSLGEFPYSENHLSELLRQNNKNGTNDTLPILATFAEAKLYLPLFSEISRLSNKDKEDLASRFPQLLFPTDYFPLVQTAAEDSKAPPELIFSIIRQESAFLPKARSPMHAFGLMQLLPSVAEQIAKRYNLSYSDPEDLYLPEVNIPIGAFTLQEALGQFQHQFTPAVASYNAPAWAVRRWLKDRYDGNMLTFIEEIPYEETRGYVKLVMRNYVSYQRLVHPEPRYFPDIL